RLATARAARTSGSLVGRPPRAAASPLAGFGASGKAPDKGRPGRQPRHGAAPPNLSLMTRIVNDPHRPAPGPIRQSGGDAGLPDSESSGAVERPGRVSLARGFRSIVERSRPRGRSARVSPALVAKASRRSQAARPGEIEESA